MTSDPLVRVAADALFEDWFPKGNDVDGEVWRDHSVKDAEVCVKVVRAALATEIEAYARENHQHTDVGGACPVLRSSADTCDLVAAYRNAARLVRGE